MKERARERKKERKGAGLTSEPPVTWKPGQATCMHSRSTLSYTSMRERERERETILVGREKKIRYRMVCVCSR